MEVKVDTGIRSMNEFDYETEGLLWIEGNGHLIKGKTPRKFFEDWKQKNDLLWVVDFKKIT